MGGPPNKEKAPATPAKVNTDATQFYTCAAVAQVEQLRSRGVLRAIFASANVKRLKSERPFGFKKELVVAAQIISLPDCRPCASCGVYVGNVNLGGYDGRSAMSGALFCLQCADQLAVRAAQQIADKSQTSLIARRSADEIEGLRA